VKFHPSLFQLCDLPHSLSLSHMQTHTLSHTHPLSLFHIHTHTISLSLFHTPHTLSLSLTHTFSLSLSLSHTHTHTISLFQTHTLSLSHSHTLFHRFPFKTQSLSPTLSRLVSRHFFRIHFLPPFSQNTIFTNIHKVPLSIPYPLSNSITLYVSLNSTLSPSLTPLSLSNIHSLTLFHT
jgi:hypothetical protein